ncbi:MAG: flagellar biosynthesis protein FlhF [Rhodocyclaceae bacterium]|nr:flagellar biosynthesis protein FlhF [Rhodocyclaceae bacterium]
MQVRRYFAKTAREALKQLKDELGADAIVLSNRSVEGGVEILALPADAVTATSPRAPAANAVVPPVVRGATSAAEDEFRRSLGRARSRQQAQATRGTDKPRPFNPPRVDPDTVRLAGREPRRRTVDHELFVGAAPQFATCRDSEAAEPLPRIASAPVAEAPVARAAHDGPKLDAAAGIRELQAGNQRLMGELDGIRNIIERQLAGFAWGEISRSAPARTRLMGELLEAGFSAELARRVADAVAADGEPAKIRNAAKNVLGRDLRAMANDADIIDRGGVYALVGPTGVGKTTTTAKLAARCVVRHGAEKLALITTDGYRIGAHEQLRIYGRILGVPVFVVRDAADLRHTLSEMRNRHMVLIDTVGMGQRDHMVAEQTAMLVGAGEVSRLLLLNATSRGDTLDDVVSAYRGPDLAGCIFTKVDEAASLAPVLDVAIRHQLELFYVANGQRVPEDLHLPNRTYLLHRALKEQPEGSPWKLRPEEAGMLMCHGSRV